MEPTLENLRKDMVKAFHAYARRKPLERDTEWALYCEARERFLAKDCRKKGLDYSPLKYLLILADD